MEHCRCGIGLVDIKTVNYENEGVTESYSIVL